MAESEYPTRIIIEDEEASIHTTSSNRNRCCFPSTTSFWKCIPRASKSQNPWWALPVRAFQKVREWSEIVAGPKWKTFIRRFNRHNRHRHQSKFQYDPLSYALNFDDQGQIGHFEGEEYSGQFPDFSSRFAAAVSHSSKSAEAPLG